MKQLFTTVCAVMLLLVSVKAQSVQKFTEATMFPFNITNFKSTVIDFNNDGLDDVIGWIVDVPNSAKLYKNNGNNTFTDVSITMNFPNNSQGRTSFVCKDLNKDGLMDLYYQSGDTLRISYNNGSSFSTPSTNCGLYFLSDILGIRYNNLGQSMFFDYDGDGIYDIIAWVNNGGTSSIVSKKGQLNCTSCGFGFSNEAVKTLITLDNSYGTTFQMADVDNDGDFDLLIAQTNGDGHFVNSTYSIYNNNNGIFSQINNSGFDGGRSYAFAQLGEFNNDGLTDIFSGSVDCCLGSNPLSTFFSTSPGVWSSSTSAMPRTNNTYYTGSTIVDIDFDKRQDVLWNIYAYYGNSSLQCLINNGDNTFTDKAADLGIQKGTPISTVDHSDQTTTIIDINNDRKPDVHILNNNVYSLEFYNNTMLLNTTTNNGIKLKLSACTGMKEGWGARIKYKTGGTWNYQEHTAYASSNYPFMYLGMGTSKVIDSLVVYWIGGAITTKTNIAAGAYVVVEENNSCTINTGINGFKPLQDTMRACGDSVVLDAGAGFATYNWSNGVATQSITAKQSGTYKVTVTTASGCTGTDSCYISILKRKIINTDASICRGNSVTLSVDTTNSDKPNLIAVFSNDANQGINVNYPNNTPPINSFSYDFWFNTNRTITLLPEKTGGVSVNAVNGQNFVIFPSHSNSPLTARGTGVSVGTNGISVIEHCGNFIDSRLSYSKILIGWHHCAVVYNNLGFSLYVDGTLVGSRKNGSNFGGFTKYDATVGLFQTIGVGYPAYDPSDNYNGNLFGLRHWKVSLSAAQVADLMSKQLVSSSMQECVLNLNFNNNSYSNTSAITKGITLSTVNGPTYKIDTLPLNGTISGSTINVPTYGGVSSYKYSYLWSTGASTASIMVSPIQTTRYYANISNGTSSCIDSVMITVNQSTTNNSNLSGCNSIIYKSKTYTSSTIVRDTVKSLQGCDSIYNVAEIKVNPLPKVRISGDNVLKGDSTILTATVDNAAGSGNFRYIKFTSTYSADNGQVNVYEIQALKNGLNIALNKPGYANSYEGGGNWGNWSNKGKSVVDGDYGSRWSSDRNNPGNASVATPIYVVVDLQQVYSVDSVVLNIAGWDNWQQTFTLQVSNDTINWTTIGAGTNVTGIFTYPLVTNSLLWSTGSTNESITVRSAGIYSVKATDVNGCSSIALDTVTSVLPVTISSINATANNKTIKADWQTATELNASHFNIQRSADGNSFTNIGTVKAVGTGANNYEFTDKNPVTGTNYYRLQNIDKDGKFSYSKVVTVQFSANNKPLTIYPNPVTNSLTISGKHIVGVQLIDNMGKVVVVKSFKDVTNPQLSVHTLNAGVYHLRIETVNGITTNVGFIKQ